MCNVQHFVTNHSESQISQEQRAALPSPFTGVHLKKITHTSCQLYVLVPLSSLLAHLLAYIYIVTITQTRSTNTQQTSHKHIS